MIKTVTYGTIKGMQVELPDGAWCAMDIINAFAKAFVKYMTASGLVSDEVLISSIGSRFCREAMVLGLEEIATNHPELSDEAVKNLEIIIRQCKEDSNWETAIIFARYGHRADYIDIVYKRMGFTPVQIAKLKTVSKSA